MVINGGEPVTRLHQFKLHGPCVLLLVAALWITAPAHLAAQDGAPLSSPFHDTEAAGEFDFTTPAPQYDSPSTQALADSAPDQPRPTAYAGSRRITPRGGTAEQSQRKFQSPAGGSSALYSTLGALAVVVLLVLGLARLWKKHSPAGRTTITSEALTVLGRKQLDPRNAVLLVRIGSRILVLGASAEGLRPLCEVTDPVEVDVLAGMCRQPAGDNNLALSFLSLFQRNAMAAEDSSHEDRSLHLPQQTSRDAPAADGDDTATDLHDPAILRLRRHPGHDASLETSSFSERAR